MLPWIASLDKLNPFTSYLFDKCVTTFLTIIKNALQETIEVGSEGSKRTMPKYTISELLNDGFQFAREDDVQGFVSTIRGVDGAFFDEVS